MRPKVSIYFIITSNYVLLFKCDVLFADSILLVCMMSGDCRHFDCSQSDFNIMKTDVGAMATSPSRNQTFPVIFQVIR